MATKYKSTFIFLSVFLLQFACNAGTTLTIQAEQAKIKTIGDIQRGAWNLWSNGEWADFVHFTKPGIYQVRVSCFGSSANGIWPEMAFSVDGLIIKTVTVASSKTTDYVFEFEAEANDYRIGVLFLNDALTQTEDRNLYIVSLSIEPPENTPVPTLVSEQAWRSDWGKEQMKLEEATLSKTAKAIEENRKSNVTLQVVDEDNRPVTDANLVVELVRHDFLFGCDIYMFDRFGTPHENELYKERFRELFNYATTGFYWRAYEPKRGKPNYDYTDKVVAWCTQNDITLKGHPLLWACEHGIPSWSKEQPPAEIQKQRVVDIMSRYAGKIKFWEVVNEPSHLPGLTIDEPYRWAREIDPEARLIVNDYDVMSYGCPSFFKLLQEAVRNGVPFDGIGIQSHEPRTMRFPLNQVWKILDQYATLGKELHITEFTPTSGGEEITGSHITGKWDETAQADYAVKFYTVCFSHPAVVAITWWDLCDDGSWRKNGGLLRKDLSPKPAYTALKKLIHEQWGTKIEGKTDADGKFSFRGFHGKYTTKITQNRKVEEQSFHLGKQKDNVINIILRNSSE